MPNQPVIPLKMLTFPFATTTGLNGSQSGFLNLQTHERTDLRLLKLEET